HLTYALPIENRYQAVNTNTIKKTTLVDNSADSMKSKVQNNSYNSTSKTGPSSKENQNAYNAPTCLYGSGTRSVKTAQPQCKKAQPQSTSCLTTVNQQEQ